jgi:hypothetical protein
MSGTYPNIRIGPPTLAGFTSWVYGVMGVPTSVLPSDAPVIGISLQIATDTVNPALGFGGAPFFVNLGATMGNEYTLATYNLAGHNLIVFAVDQPGAPPVDGSDPPQPYFAFTRKELKINAFTPGVVTSTSDEGTSVSLLNPEFMKTLGMTDMMLVKTPWGRQYMSIAQKYGTLWGLS